MHNVSMSEANGKDGLATGNWSVQLLNRWLSTAQYSRASVLLEIESSSGSFMVGVVGSNYNPSDWTRPFDREKHSAGVRAADGHVFVKGVQRPHSTMCVTLIAPRNGEFPSLPCIA